MIVEDDLEGSLEVDCGEVRTIQLKLRGRIASRSGEVVWCGKVSVIGLAVTIPRGGWVVGCPTVAVAPADRPGWVDGVSPVAAEER